ncbi:MAG: VirB3 family type IV secretion system protein [Janthinobacterium lividum]
MSMEEYKPQSHQVYKGLERPASYFGLPIQLLFVVCAVPFLLGCYLSVLFWILIPILVFLLSLLSRKDPHIYNLLYLKFKTRGNRRANSYYKANALFAQRYEPIDIFSLSRKKPTDHETE